MRRSRLSPDPAGRLDRRDFLKIGGATGFGLWLGNRSLSALAQQPSAPPPRPKTNIEDALRAPRTKYSLPGLFPGRVVEVQDAAAVKDDKPVARVVYRLVEKGLEGLTKKSAENSFGLFFSRDDIVGIKVNPVGPGTISTHLEVVDALIDWLVACGLNRKNIVIWDRFDFMLKDAGFTPERYPGVGIEGLQTMDEAAAMGKTQDNSRWLRPEIGRASCRERV